MKNHSTFRLRTNFSNCALFAFLLIGLLTSHGNSQTTTSPSLGSVNKSNDFVLPFRTTPIETTATRAEKRAATEHGEVLKEVAQYDDECRGDANCITNKLDSLKLSIPARFARGFQYQYEWIEQPGTLLVDLERRGETITTQIPNPQSFLQKHTFSFKFGELFNDRLSLFKRGLQYRNSDAEVQRFLCGHKPLITCLTKGGSWWQRVLMGASLEFSLAQRPLVQDRLFVPASIVGKDFQPHGGFVLDFAKLFPNASSWKSTFSEVQNIDKAVALLGASDVLAERKPWKQPLAFLLPKVEFKILSQFEFIKHNGAFVEPRFPERALNTWKFTWDLTRLIPDTKSRLDADSIIADLDKLRSTLGQEEPPKKYCILHLQRGVRKVEVKHGFSAESCQKLANFYGADSYELSCGSEGPDGSEVNGERRKRSESPDVRTPNCATGKLGFVSGR